MSKCTFTRVLVQVLTLDNIYAYSVGRQKRLFAKDFVLQIPCQEIVMDGPIELPLDVGQK